jgi:hypothetical protein
LIGVELNTSFVSALSWDACMFHFNFQRICEARAEAATITIKLRYNNSDSNNNRKTQIAPPTAEHAWEHLSQARPQHLGEFDVVSPWDEQCRRALNCPNNKCSADVVTAAASVFSTALRR